MNSKSSIPLMITYALLWLVIFILPYFSLPGYSILINTTSELGAQHTPNAWIMNGVFILLGLSSIFAGWGYLKGYWFQRIVLLIFGCGLVLAAFFQHAPIDSSLPFDEQKDSLHSLFATLVGFSFTLFAISTGFILKKVPHRMLAFSAGILATVLSILIFQVEAFRGLWQRLIFILCFGWMIYLYLACPLEETANS